MVSAIIQTWVTFVENSKLELEYVGIAQSRLLLVLYYAHALWHKILVNLSVC